MSTKSRKAIPLKEDIVQPTSFDLEKLCDTLNDLTKQFSNAASYFCDEGAKLETQSVDMYALTDILESASHTLKDTCEQLEAFVD